MQGSAMSDTAASPEAVYRQLLLAMLTADEKTIRALVVDSHGVEVLWEGEYPKEVAALLAEQYRTMEISRQNSDTERVELVSSAVPFPLTVSRIGGSWKVDAGPIIDARRAVKIISPETR